MVSIAFLLMRLFPQASPVAEKILRFYHKISVEILPSEQLHRDYSIASVAIRSFDLLFDRDKQLYSHLQFDVSTSTAAAGDTSQYYHSMDDSAGSTASLASDKKSLLRLSHARAVSSEGKVPAAGGPVASVYLLSGWLESGYMGGWFNGWTCTYLWDVLLCLGWEADNGMEMNFSSSNNNVPSTSSSSSSTSSPAVFSAFLPHLNCILLSVT